MKREGVTESRMERFSVFYIVSQTFAMCVCYLFNKQIKQLLWVSF